jgi:hypothetical protein
MTTIALLAELCCGLGDRARASLLYELVLPYADVNVVVGMAAVCLGPAARLPGALAATMGRRRESAELLERALAANDRLRAPV